ncbi:hypothetical protein D3C71_1628170 [compost metagenome]
MAAVGQHAHVNLAARDGHHDVGAGALLQTNTDLRVLAQKACQVVGQIGVRGMRVGPQADMAAYAGGKRRQVGMHLLQAGQHLASVAQQCLARAGQRHAARLAVQQRGVQRVFQPPDAVAGRRRRQKRARRATGEVALFRNRHKKAQVRQVVVHGVFEQVLSVRLQRTLAWGMGNCALLQMHRPSKKPNEAA